MSVSNGQVCIRLYLAWSMLANAAPQKRYNTSSESWWEIWSEVDCSPRISSWMSLITCNSFIHCSTYYKTVSSSFFNQVFITRFSKSYGIQWECTVFLFAVDLHSWNTPSQMYHVDIERYPLGSQWWEMTGLALQAWVRTQCTQFRQIAGLAILLWCRFQVRKNFILGATRISLAGEHLSISLGWYRPRYQNHPGTQNPWSSRCTVHYSTICTVYVVWQVTHSKQKRMV